MDLKLLSSSYQLIMVKGFNYDCVENEFNNNINIIIIMLIEKIYYYIITT